MSARRAEFGDFQTPPALAEEICRLLERCFGAFDSVLEPTCGRGAFLAAAAKTFPKAKIHGVEIHPPHVEAARRALELNAAQDRARVEVGDFFATDWTVVASALPGRLLMLGNPPWVTNSAVSAAGGDNVPLKSNFQGLRGIAALTGKANFDISEWMLIRLVEAARPRAVVLAVLCKAATARKVLAHAWRSAGLVRRASLHRVDAAAHFGAAVEACLFVAELGEEGPAEADWFDSLLAAEPSRRFGLVGRGQMIGDLAAYRRLAHLDGLSPYQWRSGLKHDCSAVMELSAVGEDRYRNGLGEEVTAESTMVFPLLKSTDLAHGRTVPDRWVIVPQRRVGEPTGGLARTAPRAWRYLEKHAAKFEARRSSIYRRGERFAIFGVGDYSFTPWKAAVSALHVSRRFVCVPPCDGRPVMLDDTCYFAPFESEAEAKLVVELLNGQPAQRFLQAISFGDTKRAVTVEQLSRIHFHALAAECGRSVEWATMRKPRRPPEADGSEAQTQWELLREPSP